MTEKVVRRTRSANGRASPGVLYAALPAAARHELLGVLADVLLKALTKAPAESEASDEHQDSAK